MEQPLSACPELCHNRGSCLLDNESTNKTFCYCQPTFAGESCQFAVPESDDFVVNLTLKGLLVGLGILALGIVIVLVALRIRKRKLEAGRIARRSTSTFDPPLIIVHEPRTPETKRKGGSSRTPRAEKAPPRH